MLGWTPVAKGRRRCGRGDGTIMVKELSRNTKARARVFYSQSARVTRDLYELHGRGEKWHITR